MSSICNLFKAIPDAGSAVYLFSEYTNDITTALLNDSTYSIVPSKFICMNLDLSQKTSIYKSIQNYYEHISCKFRDDASGTDKAYKNYLFGALIAELKKYTSDTAYAVNEIDVVSDEEIEGMKYDEIVCWLGPNNVNNFKLEKTDSSKSISVSSGTYISGYEKESDRKISGFDYVATAGNFTINQWNIKSTTDKGDSSFNFNTILILYNYNCGDSISYEDIPMGIYFTNNPITKYNNNTAAYNQGTSYALRVSTRFASTLDGTAFITETSNATIDHTTNVQILDKMNTTIDKINDMCSKFKRYADIVNDYTSAALVISEQKSHWGEYNVK